MTQRQDARREQRRLPWTIVARRVDHRFEQPRCWFTARFLPRIIASATIIAVLLLAAGVLIDDTAPNWVLALVFGGLMLLFSTTFLLLLTGLFSYGVWARWKAKQLQESTLTPTNDGILRRSFRLLHLLYWTKHDELDRPTRLKRESILVLLIVLIFSFVLLNWILGSPVGSQRNPPRLPIM